MRIRLSLLLTLFFTLSACITGVLRPVPTQTPLVELELTPLIDLTRPVEQNSAAAIPVATPTTEPDRSRENGRPLAARVNNQPIYLMTYEQQVARLTEALAEQNIELGDQAGQPLLTQLEQQVLEALIDQVIIEQQAVRLGLTITENELDAVLQAELERSENLTSIESWLAANDLSDEEVRATLRLQLLTNRLVEQVSRGIPETAAQAQVGYIRVADEPTARWLVEQLKQGSDFDRLAEEYSIAEPGWNDVEQGWIAQGQGVLPADVEAIAFGLEPGQMNGPIFTPRGFYIIKLLDKEVERPISQKMAQSLKQQIFLDWLAAQRSAATIERFVGW